MTAASSETFTLEEHEQHCRLAGCKHPVAYGPTQGWCDLCRSIAFRFDPVWRELEDIGACDGHGGMEYQRVATEWIEAGRPAEISIEAFIRKRANWTPGGGS